MTATRKIQASLRRCVAAAAIGLCSLVASSTSSAGGPLPIVGIGAQAGGVASVGPGIAMVVCHVAAGVEALEIPVVVQANEVSAFLAASPRDHVGACGGSGGTSGSDGATAGAAVEASAAVASGLLTTVGDGALVVVCASGDGQLFLTPTAAAALAVTDADVTFGACEARTQGDTGGGRAGSGTGVSTPLAAQSGAVFVNGRVSIPASSLSCDDRLLVTRVSTTPTLIRTSGTRVTARFVIINDKGFLVRDANVWIRSTPLGYVRAAAERRTAADGSVRFQLTTTRKMPLQAGGRLVLFARATLPGKPLIGCVTGRRLIAIRVGAPAS
jgi:hypothetical protein